MKVINLIKKGIIDLGYFTYLFFLFVLEIKRLKSRPKNWSWAGLLNKRTKIRNFPVILHSEFEARGCPKFCSNLVPVCSQELSKIWKYPANLKWPWPQRFSFVTLKGTQSHGVLYKKDRTNLSWRIDWPSCACSSLIVWQSSRRIPPWRGLLACLKALLLRQLFTQPTIRGQSSLQSASSMEDWRQVR